VENEFTTACSTLLNYQANPDSKDFNDISVLMKALSIGNKHMFFTLLEYGANPNLPTSSAPPLLLQAVDRRDSETVEVLIRGKADIHCKNSDGSTALMKAAEIPSTEILLKLLEAGAKINVTNKNGEGALSKALESGNIASVYILLERGAIVALKHVILSMCIQDESLTNQLKACQSNCLSVAIQSPPISPSNTRNKQSDMLHTGQMPEESPCIICFENPKNVVILPCRHFCICSDCSAKTTLSDCPICRGAVSGSIVVYL